MTRLLLALLALVGTLLPSGCAVGPRYEPPGSPASESLAAAKLVEGRSEGGDGPAAPESAWWRALDDPLLDDLVDRAIDANRDVAVAAARVREARALRRATAGTLRPELSASANASRSRSSEEGLGIAQIAEAGFADLENDLFQAGFDARWEIDLFGRRRLAVESSDARLEAAVAGGRATLLSVVAETARNYVELRGAQHRLRVAERNVAIQEETLALVEARRETGFAGELELQRQRALVDSTRARLPGLRAAVRTAAHRVAVLTGRAPAELVGRLLERGELPEAPRALPVDLPSELLRRRPDVQRAERRLRAATADVGVAVAELFPRFSITAALGLESTSSATLIEPGSRIWSVGGGLLAPLFQGGRLRANVDAAEARHDAALARYEQVVLLALEDVESAMVAFVEQARERSRLEKAVFSSRASLDTARVLYDSGFTDALDLLDAERSLLAVEDRLVVSQTAFSTRWIALYKALGGGWATAEASRKPRDAHAQGSRTQR